MLPLSSDNPNRNLMFDNSAEGIHSPNLESGELDSPHNGVNSPAESSTSSKGSAEVRSRSSLGGTEASLRGLYVNSNHENRSKPSHAKITEYENALAPKLRKKQSEGPEFLVVKKSGSLSGEGSQLNDFPNGIYDHLSVTLVELVLIYLTEILTQILSHLPAASLAAVSLVSKKFNNLVTSPHAWRVAFARYFPGDDDDPQATGDNSGHVADEEGRERLRAQRFFTRLTGLASWRSEYIMRTRLLRSLGRGKPVQDAEHIHGIGKASAITTYDTHVLASINHLGGVFGTGKKYPRFIHGADESGTAGTSEPRKGRVDEWMFNLHLTVPQFADHFPGEPLYGLGNGPAGLPNVMDVSQPFGIVYGGGCPGWGAVYATTQDNRNAYFLSHSPPSLADAKSGIPYIPQNSEATSAVWIAKSTSVPHATNGVIEVMTGSTLGVITAYTLGIKDPKAKIGAPMARWVISPGVPIVAISVDDSYSESRRNSRRIWAVALNALGEVFYLTDVPKTRHASSDPSSSAGRIGRHAWRSGRTVYWKIVAASRRVPHKYSWQEADPSRIYSPRSSCASLGLSEETVEKETREIERFLRYRPLDFRSLCDGWDMRRRLEVDFGGDDGSGIGEGIFAISCGFDHEEKVQIKRYTRCRAEPVSLVEYPTPWMPSLPMRSEPEAPSLFGHASKTKANEPSSPNSSNSAHSPDSPKPPRSPNSPESPESPKSPKSLKSPSSAENMKSLTHVEWRTSLLSLKSYPGIEITTSAIDLSTYALITINEDPLFIVNGRKSSSRRSSETSTFPGTPTDRTSSITIPGYRARHLAVGTKTGQIILFNMRGPQSENSQVVNELHPIRTIVTDSPQITSLAVSALFVIHGGNDGLVQAWDPLGSSPQPIRTLHSRFSSRARRRIAQAETRAQGVGINLYAAGAIVLDPDPTILRGMVALGTHLRFWHYSASAADQYQSKKRRIRRGDRGNNDSRDRYTNNGKGDILDQIAAEKREIAQEKKTKAKVDARLTDRFGVGFAGLSEEEALHYAEMASAQALVEDEERRINEAVRSVEEFEEYPTKSETNVNITTEASSGGQSILSKPAQSSEHEYDHELEEAIRLSILETDGIDENGHSPSNDYEYNFTYKTDKKKDSSSASLLFGQVPKQKQHANSTEEDLAFALQLSLAEERSREEAEDEEFPVLGFSVKGKGQRKGKGKGKGKGPAI